MYYGAKSQVQLAHAHFVLGCMYCSGVAPTVWSECSVKKIARVIAHGMDCLPVSDVGGLGTLAGVIICVLVSVLVAVAVFFGYNRYCRHTTHITKPGGGVFDWLYRAFTVAPCASASANSVPKIAKITPPMRSQVS
jgi:hypothetical protein